MLPRFSMSTVFFGCGSPGQNAIVMLMREISIAAMMPLYPSSSQLAYAVLQRKAHCYQLAPSQIQLPFPRFSFPLHTIVMELEPSYIIGEETDVVLVIPRRCQSDMDDPYLLSDSCTSDGSCPSDESFPSDEPSDSDDSSASPEASAPEDQWAIDRQWAQDGQDVSRLLVSSTSLCRASGYFSRFFASGMKGGVVQQHTHSFDIALDEIEHPYAMLILMLIIHGRRAELPPTIDFPTLLHLGKLAHYFDCRKIVASRAEDWIEDGDMLALYNSTQDEREKWLCIATVFGFTWLFMDMVSSLFRYSEKAVLALDLPIPQTIIGK